MNEPYGNNEPHRKNRGISALSVYITRVIDVSAKIQRPVAFFAYIFPNFVFMGQTVRVWASCGAMLIFPALIRFCLCKKNCACRNGGHSVGDMKIFSG